jgi:Protein of unknown function (DUF1588)/Protein of unknown function (DUF1592)/Protein of unknown function (DUF1595)
MRSIRWALLPAALSLGATHGCQTAEEGELQGAGVPGAPGGAANSDASAIKQLGLNPEPAIAKFPDDTLGAPFVASNSLNVQQVLAEKYAAAAEVLAVQAQTQGEAFFKRYASCSWSDAACIETFIGAFGRVLYRQPVAKEQLARLKSIFLAGAELSSSAEGMKYTVEAMLQSPAFLYRTEVGPATIAAGTSAVAALTSYEVASLLAFMVTDGPPDAELSRAADADALKSDAQLQAQFARLNKTPAAIEKTTAFIEALFGVSILTGVMKDEKLYPNAATIQANLQMSFRADVRSLLASGDASWGAAMRMGSYSVNAATAGVFGIANLTAPEFVKRDVAVAERKGLLTHPAVMATFSHATESAPVFRGKMVLSRLLCRPPGAPPANAETMLDPKQLPDTATRRQLFDTLIARPSCAGCHISLNAIGFSLDNYDAIGKYRTTDSKGPLDVKGEIASLQGDGAKDTYQGGAQLAERLADSKIAKECISLQSYRYFLGLPNADLTFDASTRATFVNQGAQLTQLASMILSSKNFMERVK